LVPVVLSLATIALVFWIGRRLYDDETALWAALVAAVCPFLWFISQKIWLDNMLIATVTLAVAAQVRAADRSTPAAYALAGAAFGLAFLSKITAALILPALLVLALSRDRRGFDIRSAVAFAIPAAVLCGGWEIAARTINGQWLPTSFPSAQMLRDSPFMAVVVGRPWHFYVSNILSINPLYLAALVPAAISRKRDWTLLAWFGAFVIALTAFGLLGGGYQSRHLAPAYPALAILAGMLLSRARQHRAALAGCILLIGYGMMNALIYAVLETPRVADFQFSAARAFVQLLAIPEAGP
jgi:4-amino-4-deoxy-L-arabinose transferase-like glycosyltransferase